MTTAPKRKADLKVVLIGEADVGKTALVTRYIEGSFQEGTQTTLGASFFLKQWGPYNVAVWDTAGEERFSGLSSFYCRDAGAAVMTFDLRSRQSFESLKTRFLNLLPEGDCMKLIVGAKLDLLTENPDEVTDEVKLRAVPIEEARQLAMDINEDNLAKNPNLKTPYCETSSKTGAGVTEAFEFIFDNCLAPISTDYKIKPKQGTIKLTAPPAPQPQRKRCCLSS